MHVIWFSVLKLLVGSARLVLTLVVIEANHPCYIWSINIYQHENWPLVSFSRFWWVLESIVNSFTEKEIQYLIWNYFDFKLPKKEIQYIFSVCTYGFFYLLSSWAITYFLFELFSYTVCYAHKCCATQTILHPCRDAQTKSVQFSLVSPMLY